MKSSRNGKFEAEFLEWVWKETENRKGRGGGVEEKSGNAFSLYNYKTNTNVENSKRR